MDCQTARQLFSEHQDRRLHGDLRHSLLGHLEMCTACREIWLAYSRVFDLVAQLPEVPALRPLAMPDEAPGSLDFGRFSLRSWGGLRVAAAAAVLLAVSHVAVFEWARSGGEAPLSGGEPLPVLQRGETVALEAGMLPQKIRDHVDAVDVLTRQIAMAPSEAGSECRKLVRAQMELLGAEELAAEAERARGRPEGDASAAFRRYLSCWRGFCRDLEQELPGVNDQMAVPWLQDRVEQSGLAEAIEPVMRVVAAEPLGRTWQGSSQLRRLERPEIRGGFPDVGYFLQAQAAFLRADYPSARGGFRALPSALPQSRLVPLARYMEAECLRRLGRPDQALSLVVSDLAEPSAIRTRSIRVILRDPLVLPFLLRTLPAAPSPGVPLELESMLSGGMLATGLPGLVPLGPDAFRCTWWDPVRGGFATCVVTLRGGGTPRPEVEHVPLPPSELRAGAVRRLR